MGYNMKRGNKGVPFRELGSSPAKQDDKFLKEQREEKVESTDYLHKTPNPTVASKIALEDYDPKEDDSKETERINTPPATKPPRIAEVLDQDKYSDLEKYDDDK